MEWCLDCHRHPENVVREKKDIFNMEWKAPATQSTQEGPELVRKNKIQGPQVLTSCSTCHR